MIAEAEKKLRGRKLAVTFLRKDMRRFAIPVRVGLVTSFFDSLNHLLSTSDLLMTFRRVFSSLEEGAYFIFDVNNEHCYRTVWRQTEAIRRRDFALVLNNRYDPDTRLAEANVSIMVKGRTGEEEYHEVVRERWYPGEEISAALQEAGFQVRTAEDFNFTHNPEVGDLKTWWVAQK
jgi:hypothetical protein